MNEKIEYIFYHDDPTSEIYKDILGFESFDEAYRSFILSYILDQCKNSNWFLEKVSNVEFTDNCELNYAFRMYTYTNLDFFERIRFLTENNKLYGIDISIDNIGTYFHSADPSAYELNLKIINTGEDEILQFHLEILKMINSYNKLF